MLKLEDTFLEKTTKRNREKRGCIFTCFDILLMSRKLEFNCIEMNLLITLITLSGLRCATFSFPLKFIFFCLTNKK